MVDDDVEAASRTAANARSRDGHGEMRAVQGVGPEGERVERSGAAAAVVVGTVWWGAANAPEPRRASDPVVAGQGPAPSFDRDTENPLDSNWPQVGEIDIAPPDWRAKPKTWVRPRPVPLPTGLVVKNGSNTRSRCSGAMPAPVSATEMRT